MIRFPKMHIAASVVNRIINIRDELNSGRVTIPIPVPAEAREPEVPDPETLGIGIDEAIGTTPTELPGAEPGTEANAAVASIAGGGTALEGLIAKQAGTEP